MLLRTRYSIIIIMGRRIGARGIVVKDGKLLAVKLKDYDSDGAKVLGVWVTPGGKVNTDEPLIKAAEREMIEETGVKPVIGNLLYIQQFKQANGVEQLEFFFHILNTDDYQDIDLSKSSHGQTEIAELEFIDVKNSVILPDFLRQESFDNLVNQPVKFFAYFD